jgi:hypothetical protein
MKQPKGMILHGFLRLKMTLSLQHSDELNAKVALRAIQSSNSDTIKNENPDHRR